MTKGIILAGGTGSRLHPMTISVSKALMPVYDKPMIYYPLSTLIASGINDILVITTKKDINLFRTLLQDGSQWGCSISYAVQNKPNGIAESLIIAEDFIGNDNVALILGDNIFYFPSLSHVIKNSLNTQGATIFAYHVADPSRYGVADFEVSSSLIRRFQEKPPIEEAFSNLINAGTYLIEPELFCTMV